MLLRRASNNFEKIAIYSYNARKSGVTYSCTANCAGDLKSYIMAVYCKDLWYIYVGSHLILNSEMQQYYFLDFFSQNSCFARMCFRILFLRKLYPYIIFFCMYHKESHSSLRPHNVETLQPFLQDQCHTHTHSHTRTLSHTKTNTYIQMPSRVPREWRIPQRPNALETVGDIAPTLAPVHIMREYMYMCVCVRVCVRARVRTSWSEIMPQR